MKRLHIIRNKGHIILYDVDNMDLFIGNNLSESQLTRIKEDENKIDFLSEDERIIKYDKTQERNVTNKPNMHRITVCVSNDCNLRCKYCYAQGGSYGMERNVMRESTAKDFVKFCVENFNKIDNVLFFGGEPLLNYKIIQYICNLFEHFSKVSKFTLPSFSIITNGTLCNDDILALIHNKISSVTVSIDGDKPINDTNRVFPNGKGSYDKICYFIKKCKENANIQIQFEATYTAAHVKQGLSRFEIYSFLSKTFGIDGIIADEEKLSMQNRLDNLHNLTKQDMLTTKFCCLPMDFWQVTSTIVGKKPHKFCGLFDDRITVTTNGDIVACQMVIGSPQNIVGNIYEPCIVDKIKQNKRYFKSNNICSKCWCNHLCGGCAVQKFYSKNNKNFNATPNHGICFFTKLYIEEMLYKMQEIRMDGELWPLFIEITKTKMI